MESYKISLANYEHSKKNCIWDRKRFALGQISKLSLMQSELDYLDMENKKNSAGYDFYKSLSAIRLAEAGILQ
ncbi:MAG: hypothetical protein ACOY46_04755 [Bacillota bacterium]